MTESPLDHFAQPIGDFGDITGTGLGNLLGAPRASAIETMLREALQNSWDARLPGVDHIEFDVEYRRLNEHEVSHLRRSVLRNLPPGVTISETPSVLILSDRNTRGLAGPVRPSSVSEDYRDFVNFVYMVGETKPLESQYGVSGGTYGYGRSSLFRVSAPHIVFAYTRCVSSHEPLPRLIGMGWSEKYRIGQEQYTGRHWWGTRHEDGWVGPAIGPDADGHLRGLGIEPPVGTGTTLILVDPKFESSEAAKAEVVDAILRNAWPKMIRNEVKFSIMWEGEHIVMPSPKEHPTLRLFAQALQAAGGESTTYSVTSFPIWIDRPKKHLGNLGMKRTIYVPDVSASTELINGEHQPLRHIALMRSNYLVVDYLEASQSVVGEQYCGVFVVEPEVENVFARSEPPSHDAWVVERLSEAHEKSYVRVALRRIGAVAKDFVQPKAPVQVQQKATKVTKIARALNDLLPDTFEKESRGGSKSSPTGGQRAKLRVVDETTTKVSNGFERTVDLAISSVTNARDTILYPNLQILTDAGVETQPPIGASTPRLLDCTPSLYELDEGSYIRVPSNVERVVIRFFQPDDCQVRLNIEIAKEEQ